MLGKLFGSSSRSALAPKVLSQSDVPHDVVKPKQTFSSQIPERAAPPDKGAGWTVPDSPGSNVERSPKRQKRVADALSDASLRLDSTRPQLGGGLATQAPTAKMWDISGAPGNGHVSSQHSKPITPKAPPAGLQPEAQSDQTSIQQPTPKSVSGNRGKSKALPELDSEGELEPEHEVESTENEGSSNEEESGEYEVEAVRSHRYNRAHQIEYRVKWKGYDDDESTWEPLESLENCEEMLSAYHARIGYVPPRIKPEAKPKTQNPDGSSSVKRKRGRPPKSRAATIDDDQDGHNDHDLSHKGVPELTGFTATTASMAKPTTIPPAHKHVASQESSMFVSPSPVSATAPDRAARFGVTQHSDTTSGSAGEKSDVKSAGGEGHSQVVRNAAASRREEDEQYDEMSDGEATWRVSKYSWDKDVHSIITVQHSKKTHKLVAEVKWRNRRTTSVEASLLRTKCPNKLIDFYEAHLKFV